MLIPKARLSELYAVCLEKINEYKNAGTLKKNPNFISILYRWKDWSQSEDWKEYIKEMIKEDEGLIEFLKRFIFESHSQSFSDYVGKRVKKINFESIGNFVSLDEVKTRLEPIRLKNNQIYNNHKDAVDIFLDNFGKANGPLDD